MDKKTIIKLENISKYFKKSGILENLSLEIREKEIIALLGKSGCGKTTFLKILIGFYKPDKGVIFYHGKNLYRDLNTIKKITGFVTQENSFYEKLTVQENLKFFASLYNVSSKNIRVRIAYLLNLVKLSAFRHTVCSQLSGGMKRRLEFAISLMHNPLILILDEPFTGLDIKIRDELWEVVKHIRDSGVTIVVSTHLILSAQRNADRVLILHDRTIKKDFLLKEEELRQSGFNLEREFLEVVSK